MGKVFAKASVHKFFKKLFVPDDDLSRRRRDTEGLIALLVGPKSSKDPKTRWEAARTLGAIGDRQAVEPLIVALSDRGYFHDDDGWPYYVYLEAVDALARIGDDRAVQPLITLLSEVSLQKCYHGVDDYSPHKLSGVARALGQLHAPKAVDALLDVLKKAQGLLIGYTGLNIAVFKSVIDALGEIGDPRAVGPLNDLMNNKNYFVFAYPSDAEQVYGQIAATLSKIRSV